MPCNSDGAHISQDQSNIQSNRVNQHTITLHLPAAIGVTVTMEMLSHATISLKWNKLGSVSSTMRPTQAPRGTVICKLLRYQLRQQAHWPTIAEKRKKRYHRRLVGK